MNFTQRYSVNVLLFFTFAQTCTSSAQEAKPLADESTDQNKSWWQSLSSFEKLSVITSVPLFMYCLKNKFFNENALDAEYRKLLLEEDMILKKLRSHDPFSNSIMTPEEIKMIFPLVKDNPALLPLFVKQLTLFDPSRKQLQESSEKETSITPLRRIKPDIIIQCAS